jgi:hypothetical protein
VGRPSFEFRLGDHLRLRKAHPCGGWTWHVVRLGADIGLTCDTCGRRVLLDRANLEKRVKKIIERGPESPAASGLSTVPGDSRRIPSGPTFNVGDIYEATAELEVVTRFYYTSSVSSGQARIEVGDRVCIVEAQSFDSESIIAEPVDIATFQHKFVPGGVRAQQSYMGCAIVFRPSDLVGSFRRVAQSPEL